MREENRLRIFENRVLKKIFGLKKAEVTGKWRILHNNELYDLSSSENIIRLTKSIRMGWVGYVARGRQERCIQGLGGNLSERDHLEDIGVDGRIILKFTFKKWDGGID